MCLEPKVSAQVGLFRSSISDWEAGVGGGAAAASNVNTSSFPVGVAHLNSAVTEA